MKHFLLIILGIICSPALVGMESSQSAQPKPDEVVEVPVAQSPTAPAHNTYPQVTPVVKFSFAAINKDLQITEHQDRVLYWYNALKKYAGEIDEDAFGKRVAFGKILEKEFHDPSVAGQNFIALKTALEKDLERYKATEHEGLKKFCISWWRSLAKPAFFTGIGLVGFGCLLKELVKKENPLMQKTLTHFCTLISCAGAVNAIDAFFYRDCRKAQYAKKIADLLVDSATKNYASTVLYSLTGQPVVPTTYTTQD